MIAMLAPFGVTFGSPVQLWIAAALMAAALALVLIRRATRPLDVLLPIAGGMLLLALAAGEPSWMPPQQAATWVMVDLSPSTRTAGYRRAEAREARVRELLGSRPYHTIYFAESSFETAPAGDLPARRTVFEPPSDADAIVLFSDGRFTLPTIAPPTFSVIDAQLADAADAAVNRLELRGSTLAAAVTNAGKPRELTLAGDRRTAGSGVQVYTAEISPATAPATAPPAQPTQPLAARLAPGDAWPENDALAIQRAAPHHSERWWVGNAPPPGWRGITPSSLPPSPAAYLAPSVVVLNNVPAAALTPRAQDRLMQYVRDLGGSLLIVGGERSFAAGGYAGTLLDTLSPLASTPPLPAGHWIMLLDRSGSMAADASGRPRIAIAAAAAVDLARLLPPSDLLTAGSFAKDVSWWTRRVPVESFSGPPQLSPGGPTNLDAALRAAIEQAHAALSNHIILLSDADAALDATGPLAAAMKEKNFRLHVLALSRGRASEPLRKLTEAVGGTFAEQLDVARWRTAARELAGPITPDYWMTTPAEVRFEQLDLPPRTVPQWNHTWVRPQSQQLAFAGPAAGGASMGARHQIGEGLVAAFAFPLPPEEIERIARQLASPPRDPRFSVTWDAGSLVSVFIDAHDASKYLNGLHLTLEIAEATMATLNPARSSTTRSALQPIPQVGPGRYHIAVDAPAVASIATVRLDGRVLDRIPLAGRYPAEFDAIGLDRAALTKLAQRTGGEVVEPDERGPLKLPRPRRGQSLVAYLSAAGALLLGAGLIRWRMAH